MASVKNSDIPEIFEFMSEMWGFMKKFWVPEEGDEYWSSIISETDKLAQKYEDDFCKGYIFFIADYLEWKYQKSTGVTNRNFTDWKFARRKS